jgi:hypothetical protein
MLSLHRAVLGVCLCALAAVPAAAQSEAELKDFFEGKSVLVKIDMPATQEGIDVYPDARRPMDMNQYSQRLKSYGVAIHNGESVMVTRVRVKDKLIEFQLAGGGYGTFGDDTSGSVYVPSATKTQREKDLEREVKNETDSARKRRLQRELDDLRAEREREDSRNRARAASASEAKKERIANDRLHSGSRFNIRYQEGVPPGLDAGGVKRALEQYVEFPSAGGPRSQTAPRDDARPAFNPTSLHKGMMLADVEEVLGKADKTAQRREGTLTVTSASYTSGDHVITAEFVEGVLIKYSISSK